MGASKRFAEMIVLDAAHRTGSAYLRGAVLVMFWAAEVALYPYSNDRLLGWTDHNYHPDMKRYFIDDPWGCYILVLQAAGMK